MDPLHPILPVAPSIPSVTPAPMAGGVDRNGARSNPDLGKRRRRRPEDAAAAYVSEDGLEYYSEDLEDNGDSGDDDEGLHVNVTA